MKRYAALVLGGALLLGGVVVSQTLAGAQTDPHPACAAGETRVVDINGGGTWGPDGVLTVTEVDGTEWTVEITDPETEDLKIMFIWVKDGGGPEHHEGPNFRPNGVDEATVTTTEFDLSHIDVCLGTPPEPTTTTTLATTTTTLATTTTTVPATTTTVVVAGAVVTQPAAPQVLGEVVTAPAAEPVQAQPRFTG